MQNLWIIMVTGRQKMLSSSSVKNIKYENSRTAFRLVY